MIIAPYRKNSLNLSKLPTSPIPLYNRHFSNIHRLYDSVAADYSRAEAKFRDDLISRPLIVELARFYGHGKRVVDVGCGDGHISRLVSSFAERVVGVDISNPMLHQARTRSADFKNISYVRANFLNLKPVFQSQKFDLALGVFAFCCARSTNELDWAFGSIYQVLENGGIAIIQIPDESEQSAQSISEWIKETPYPVDKIGKLVQRELKTVDGNWVNVARYHYRKSDYLESITKAGFKLADILSPKASADLLSLHPSLQHEAEVSSSLVFVLNKKLYV